jgi:hypothetical protein
MNLETKKTRLMLSGESGDVGLFATDDRLLLFNRSFESQNYRVLQDDVRFSDQQQFAGGQIGDPHDVLDLGGDKLLLAHFTEGTLIVIDQNSGEEIERVEGEWDLPSGSTLKPEALIRYGDTIYVVHQALSFESGKMIADGSQQVFLLDAESLKPIDLDRDSPKIQGIKLVGSFPIPVAQKNRILLVSLCSSFETQDCRAAIEEISTVGAAPKTSHVLWNDPPAFMNGGVTPGSTEDIFYANVELPSSRGSHAKAFARFDLRTQAIESVHEFSSAGFWGAFFHGASDTLYIGDESENGGQFIVIESGSKKTSLPLEGAPYSGTFW